MNVQDITIVIGAVGTLVVSMLGVFYKITRDSAKERASTAKVNAELIAELTKVVQENSDVNRQVVESSRRVAEATERSANEAKERNGHLAELQLKSQEMIDRNLAMYNKGFKELKCQSVSKQTVNEQVIKHSTKE